MEFIGVYKKNTKGYRNLEVLARELTHYSGRGLRYYVGNGYLDINTGQTYTTVMCTINGITIHCLGAQIYQMTVTANKDSLIEIAAEMFFDEEDCLDFRLKDSLF
ncbi:MAG: hypothetical protein J5800_09855 [Spirochaetales bacterium]|nr:hypothetical protein [Spirochaetales bacterium]